MFPPIEIAHTHNCRMACRVAFSYLGTLFGITSRVSITNAPIITVILLNDVWMLHLTPHQIQKDIVSGCSDSVHVDWLFLLFG